MSGWLPLKFTAARAINLVLPVEFIRTHPNVEKKKKLEMSCQLISQSSCEENYESLDTDTHFFDLKSNI